MYGMRLQGALPGSPHQAPKHSSTILLFQPRPPTLLQTILLVVALEECSTSIREERATSAVGRSLLYPPASENLPPRPAPELFTARHLKHASFEAKTLAPHLGHSQSFWCMLADDKTKPKWLRTLLWLLCCNCGVLLWLLLLRLLFYNSFSLSIQVHDF